MKPEEGGIGHFCTTNEVAGNTGLTSSDETDHHAGKESSRGKSSLISRTVSQVEMEGSKLDLVVFGATGITGKYTVLQLVELATDVGDLKWGVAGRSQDKLESVLRQISSKTGKDLSKIKIIVADVTDLLSLRNMTSQTRVLINTVGPYKLYGEPVVKACIDGGCHYVDVSAEPQQGELTLVKRRSELTYPSIYQKLEQYDEAIIMSGSSDNSDNRDKHILLFMERMQLEYHEAAKQKNVYIINACGFDCIPVDLGTVFLVNNFKGDVNSVECYLEVWQKTFMMGSAINYGTWHSAVYLMSEVEELKSIRKKLFPDCGPKMHPTLKHKWFVHKNKAVGGWSVPFPTADRSVIARSQRYFLQHNKQRPIQLFSYVTFPYLLLALAVWMLGGLLLLAAKFKAGREFILKHPRLLSGGLVGFDPSEKAMSNLYFSFTLYGKGWKDKMTEPTDQHTEKPNKTLVVKVSGNNPAYGATCVALVLSAVTVVQQADKMPASGGVYTPGVAFGKTTLIEDLNKHGVKFELVSVKEI
ncbi:unnamed protein product [Timema podura]|uniref:Saccharopine dehydrogenase NADP binding domain-containing protein n=1 Tax=Timema podura TaxID=61482 RepID=A0ABN7NWM2_TIMPD|nr:unnamed protein product [Timema podura]